MTGARVYSDPMPVDEALCEVTRCDGTQFHPDAVAALKQLDEQGRLTEAGALVRSR
jgi:HD-GYP domain-containing protein (c-di-GMP phosphodiesterase class II)